MKNLYVLLLVFGLASAYGQTTYLTEHFDYDADVEIRAHGWAAHSASDQNPIKTSAEGLAMSNTMYAGNGIGRAALVINNGSDENKAFSGWVQQPADGESPVHTYAALLIKPNGQIPEATGNTRPYFFHLVEYADPDNPEPTSISTAHRARTFIYPGTLPNTFRLNLSFNQNEPDPANQTNNFNSTETHLLVIKYTSIAGPDNDEVSLYVFKDGDDISSEPATPTIGPLVGTNRDVVLQAVALRQYQDEQNVIVDGLIVKDHWDFLDNTNSVNEEAFRAGLKVFPNPVSGGMLNIVTATPGAMQVRAFDVAGKLVANAYILDGQLDVSAWGKGVYFLSIIQDNKVYSHKLIVH